MLSSNIINIIQYLATIILNKNVKKLWNRVIIFEIIISIITILLPILILLQNTELNLKIVPLFIILFFFFLIANNRITNIYLNVETSIEGTKGLDIKKYNHKIIKRYSTMLAFVGIALFVVGELLGNTLEKLCIYFNVSEITIGIVLGFITSIPELISFFEAQKYHKRENENILGVVEATNNLLTSNMINLFIIQTIGILLSRI